MDPPVSYYFNYLLCSTPLSLPNTFLISRKKCSGRQDPESCQSLAVGNGVHFREGKALSIQPLAQPLDLRLRTESLQALTRD